MKRCGLTPTVLAARAIGFGAASFDLDQCTEPQTMTESRRTVAYPI
jgi:hypothetical protein